MSDEHNTPGNSAPSEEHSQDVRTAAKARRGFWAGLVVGAVLVTATMLLIVQNRGWVKMSWLTFSFDAPLWLFLLASALAGAILALLAVPLSRWARARATRRRAARRRLMRGGSR
jgi:uncharacterized integral membrane protein